MLGTVLGAGDTKTNKHAVVPLFKFLAESRQTNNYTDHLLLQHVNSYNRGRKSVVRAQRKE